MYIIVPFETSNEGAGSIGTPYSSPASSPRGARSDGRFRIARRIIHELDPLRRPVTRSGLDMYSPQGYLLPAIRPSPDPRRPNMERRSPADFARGLALSQKHLGISRLLTI
jgi:hypothetical protein